MARYKDAKCKLCRREGMKLFLKGAKCNTEKCPFTKRPYSPGVHGKRQSKPSYYSLQLREKQKAKRLYGVLERQFRRFFSLAHKAKGATGGILIQVLERRLDNVIYRSLFALSRSEARQIVRHGFVFLGQKRMNIPSYLVEEGQTIHIKGGDNILKNIRQNIDENSKERSVSPWLSVDKNDLKIEIVRLPERGDVTLPINEQLIVELYSK
ncbi:MAG: 30S ribosomal protein S4 [Candidatus Omnitrophica bacterium 4484_171]|nr:MAG: 30S ribosomal protein S4 [Candidatus Omnitrophica bacterium 4484_171]